MIITRTPFRITLGGGGTDLPSFYEQHGGFVFSMAINKYMFLLLNKRSVADRKIMLRYSQVETVSTLDEIRHPLAREAFRLHNLQDNIELTSIADMPAQSGLGSSGSFIVGLLTAIRAFKNQPALPHVVAEEACYIEMNILKEKVGKQDQFIAAYGGFRTFEIGRDGAVTVGTVPVDFITVNELVSKARIYYTGVQRSATSVLQHQDEAMKRRENPSHARVTESLCQIMEIGRNIKTAFEKRDLDAFARLMDDHWTCKKRLSSSVSLSHLDQLYDQVKKEFGVLGGKIIGAGGGGFFMLYCPQKGRELDAFMASHGMPRISYFPSLKGAHVVSDLTAFDDFDYP
jgi:D-glycero-alpha-D-manno-heptose-7-phosphate kinase